MRTLISPELFEMTVVNPLRQSMMSPEEKLSYNVLDGLLRAAYAKRLNIYFVYELAAYTYEVNPCP